MLTATRFHVRWLLRRDMQEVLDIEQLSFLSPWADDVFLRVLRQRNCIGMVIAHGERVVGFMVYELRKRSLHVLNFAVHPAWRRRGVGREMAKKLFSKLDSRRRIRITLDVSERSLDAQLFFRRMGYMCEAIDLGHFDNGDDALRMVYRL